VFFYYKIIKFIKSITVNDVTNFFLGKSWDLVLYIIIEYYWEPFGDFFIIFFIIYTFCLYLYYERKKK